MRLILNRCFDVAFALIVLIGFAPVWVIIACAIAIGSRGPVFFRPERLGQRGRRFRVWKFRTMTATSSSTYEFTPLGRWLRRLGLDEVPQLFNVLSGQMRIVGPRPENPEWLDSYAGKNCDLLDLRPGITGSTTLTLIDETRLLNDEKDRATAYRKDVLPLKLAGDWQFHSISAVYGSLAVFAIITMQFLGVLVRKMPVFWRRVIKIGADGAVVVLSVFLAHFARLGWDGAVEYLPTALTMLPLLAALRLGMLYLFGAFRTYWRYTSTQDITRLVTATTVSSLMFAGLLYMFNLGPSSYPRSVFFIEWSLCTLGLIAVRVLRSSTRRLMYSRLVTPHERTRVLIYGAGDAGASLAASLLSHPSERHPVAFIDDNQFKSGALVNGIPVLGDGTSIKSIVETLGVDEIIIAIPSANGEQMRRIIFQCEDLPCNLTTLPSLKEILAGQHRDRVREVRVEDLLEREAAQVDMDAISELIRGERILVTGAGGSIGSELCRQIVSFQPEQLILLGHGENSIFEMQQELRECFDFTAHAVVADIQDRARLTRVFRATRPTVVFHAAAHKHVPLMEQNPEEAVKNNILGTLNLAEVAVEAGVERFLMVSSDKAVNPTSVMGATKRVAEMVIQTMACDPSVKTCFTAVRFGNVLGSRGSLIPILRRQIARGGPVTITHPDMVRYFMTIPEAVQLMLQACSMGEQGEVFVLDMGEPVKILDLARNLIRLSGLVLDKDIDIVYTGIRPGEKLFEELLTTKEGATATRHSQVFIAKPTPPDIDVLAGAISRLESAALQGDHEGIRAILGQLIPHHPSSEDTPVPEIAISSEIMHANGNGHRTMSSNGKGHAHGDTPERNGTVQNGGVSQNGSQPAPHIGTIAASQNSSPNGNGAHKNIENGRRLRARITEAGREDPDGLPKNWDVRPA